MSEGGERGREEAERKRREREREGKRNKWSTCSTSHFTSKVARYSANIIIAGRSG